MFFIGESIAHCRLDFHESILGVKKLIFKGTLKRVWELTSFDRFKMHLTMACSYARRDSYLLSRAKG